MRVKPPYILFVDDHGPLRIAQDPESQRGLWLLIRQRTGLNRVAARALLDDGKMIWGGELLVVRDDVVRGL